jgi:hypothetical protein
MPFSRVTLFCNHGATMPPCTRFFLLVTRSGDFTIAIQPL